MKSTTDCQRGGSVMTSIFGPAGSDHEAALSHQSKLTASSSIQDGHQLKPVELNIVLWYIYILKLDLIFPRAERFRCGPPPLNAHAPPPAFKMWMRRTQCQAEEHAETIWNLQPREKKRIMSVFNATFSVVATQSIYKKSIYTVNSPDRWGLL